MQDREQIIAYSSNTANAGQRPQSNVPTAKGRYSFAPGSDLD